MTSSSQLGQLGIRHGKPSKEEQKAELKQELAALADTATSTAIHASLFYTVQRFFTSLTQIEYIRDNTQEFKYIQIGFGLRNAYLLTTIIYKSIFGGDSSAEKQEFTILTPATLALILTLALDTTSYNAALFTATETADMMRIIFQLVSDCSKSCKKTDEQIQESTSRWQAAIRQEKLDAITAILEEELQKNSQSNSQQIVSRIQDTLKQEDKHESSLGEKAVTTPADSKFKKVLKASATISSTTQHLGLAPGLILDMAKKGNMFPWMQVGAVGAGAGTAISLTNFCCQVGKTAKTVYSYFWGNDQKSSTDSQQQLQQPLLSSSSSNSSAMPSNETTNQDNLIINVGKS